MTKNASILKIVAFFTIIFFYKLIKRSSFIGLVLLIPNTPSDNFGTLQSAMEQSY